MKLKKNIRKLDDLCRVIMPPSVQKEMGWKKNTMVEIISNKATNSVILKGFPRKEETDLLFKTPDENPKGMKRLQIVCDIINGLTDHNADILEATSFTDGDRPYLTPFVQQEKNSDTYMSFLSFDELKLVLTGTLEEISDLMAEIVYAVNNMDLSCGFPTHADRIQHKALHSEKGDDKE